MMIAAKDFRDEELLKPKEVLEAQGVKVVLVSTTRDETRGMRGTKVKPDLLLSELKVDDYATIVFVGGDGCKRALGWSFL